LRTKAFEKYLSRVTDLIYEIKDHGIVILAFIHGARQLPSNLG